MKKRMWEEVKDWLWRHRRPVVAVCCILSVLGITAAVTLTVQGRRTMAAESIQEGIAGEIIRFHVIANSDSQEDQDLKLLVKDQIVKYMEPILKDAGDISETRVRIQDHLGEIEEKATEVIKSQGYDYPVEAGADQMLFSHKNLWGLHLSGRRVRGAARVYRGGAGQKLVVRPLSQPLLYRFHPRSGTGGTKGRAEKCAH